METILIVDDEELNRELLSGLLGQDYNVVTATSGEEAIASATEHKPDLILLDILMGGIDGYETCERLKADPETQDSQVIFVSAKNNEDEIMQGYQVGGVDYLVKPFIPTELKQKIRLNIENQGKKSEWETRLNETSQVAFQAMTDASIYGAICQFYVEALKCEDYEQLAKKMLALTTEWGLKTTLQIFADDEPLTYYDTPAKNPIEEKVLIASREKGRIVDFGERSIFNGKHCSFLIKNMPLDDPAKYGAFKDYLAFLLDGMEGRIVALSAEETVRKRNKQLQKVFLYMLGNFRTVQDKNYQLRSSSAEIVEQMMEDLQLSITEIGAVNELSLDSENAILGVGQQCLSNTNELFSTGLKFVEQIEHLIESFETTLARDELTDTDLNALLEVLEHTQQRM